MKELGIENFKFEVIDTVDYIDKETLLIRESVLMNEYNSIETGYNMKLSVDLQKCCTGQNLRRMVCSVLPFQVDRALVPTPSTALTDSSRRRLRVQEECQKPSPEARAPKRVNGT